MKKAEDALLSFDRYMTRLVAREDIALRKARAESLREGLPEINVSASEGKLLHVLALMCGAKRILEIGTLGGYSAIWLARALPAGGKLISLEINAHHAEMARRNILRAGLSKKVEIRVGPALASLARMKKERPFDLVFIDADKGGYVKYLERAMPLLRPGGLLLADNTLAQIETRPYNAAAAAHRDLVSIIVPVLRDVGVDGLMISMKKKQSAVP